MGQLHPQDVHVRLFNLMCGLLTPPMGLAPYLVSDIAKGSMKDVLREKLPFCVPIAATQLLIMYIRGSRRGFRG